MPRRRPAQLRARLRIHQRPGQQPLRHISRVSVSTVRAIAELEHAWLHPGTIVEALDGWARFVRGPARLLNDYEAGWCPCSSCDRDYPEVLRHTLYAALHALPAKAARELRALIKPLDEIYLARSVPGPETADLRDLLTVVPVRAKVRSEQVAGWA